MAKKMAAGMAALMMVFFSTGVVAEELLSIKVGYQMLRPSGELAAEELGFGTNLDLEDDLDLGDSDNVTAEVGLNLGSFLVTAGYLPLSFEGSSTLTRSIMFNGDLFRVGSEVDSSLDVDIFDLGLTWFLLNFDDGPARFKLGLEVAVKFTDVEASIDDLTFGLSDSVSENVPLPTLGLRGQIALTDFAGISGRVGYLTYSDNHFLDGDIRLEISPIPLVGIYGGYRVLDIEIDESDILLDADFSGLYGGGFIRF